MPLVRDPDEILLDIGSKNGWNPADIAYLATVTVDDYEAMLKKLRGADLQTAIRVALQFGEFNSADANDREVGIRMTEALRRIADQGPLNRMRVKPYLKDEVQVGDGEQTEANTGAGESGDTDAS